MFGGTKIIETVERVLKQHTWNLNWRVEQLQREIDDLRTWNGKVRDKNSALRRERRRLRELLDDHNIPWQPGT
jgi:regulator of replication initiation timing